MNNVSKERDFSMTENCALKEKIEDGNRQISRLQNLNEKINSSIKCMRNSAQHLKVENLNLVNDLKELKVKFDNTVLESLQALSVIRRKHQTEQAKMQADNGKVLQNDYVLLCSVRMR